MREAFQECSHLNMTSEVKYGSKTFPRYKVFLNKKQKKIFLTKMAFN
jgi:hypothetical protein